MGAAKQRGTFEQRRQQALEAGRGKGAKRSVWDAIPKIMRIATLRAAIINMIPRI